MYIKGTGICGGMAVAAGRYVEKLRRADRDERTQESAQELEIRLAELTQMLHTQLRAQANGLRARDRAGEAEILEMQSVMLRDDLFQNAIRRWLREGYSLAAAIVHGAEEQQDAILATKDPYLIERVSDVADMSARLIYAAWGRRYPDLSDLDRPVIVVAEDLQPSLLVSADPALLKGIVLAGGSRTSHIAILAAGRGLPAVVGCGDLGPLISALGTEDTGVILLNAEAGEVHFGLSTAELAQARERAAAYLREQESLAAYRDVECLSADGERIRVYGNIMEAAAADQVSESGGDGVGLFRTEFLYMNRSTLPGEEEQFGVYRAAVRKMKGRPVTIRTLDLGADKQTPALDLGREENPFLGFRAIRVCLARPELFRTQLRAILRASAFGTVKIMFPMISRMSELDEALGQLEGVKAELRAEGKDFDEAVQVGMMVEVPSAAVLARQFIRRVDFFSVGSNDLTQYTLAVDRMNERIADLYDSRDPAVLTLIRSAIRAADEAGKSCSLCGEMGADPTSLPLLLGLGLRQVSVNPSAILRTKKLISTMDCAKLRVETERLLGE